MVDEKEMLEQELEKLIETRDAFLAYLDVKIPKDEKGLNFDFSTDPMLDAKSVYEHFYKLDYQARKIRGFLVGKFGLKA
ncbi:hypothetical protein [Sulfurospirillum deleyianum]|uniref:Uncharacterized protein n=1 Tax=Sulfurospirillum deleyianum (strain ATCC 51133 / DSM 6946 / 5175) TaxID=525898 RepID=D1AZE1_SULD5|nr:hypothetical protein [Sulfurospirillum deleyianum]ACZ11408.1 conserved hypothetical protein [Sulfurospirillum deleyianum DSM 6946]